MKVQRTYFTQIPDMVAERSTPYELALFRVYMKTGQCWKTNETLAGESNMSVSKVKSARKGLMVNGFITVIYRNRFSPPLTTIDEDVWVDNHNYYQLTSSPENRGESPENRGESPENRGESPENRGGSPESHKTYPFNQESFNQEVINQESSSKESPENLGFPPVTNIDDDDDFLNFDNLAIDGLFKTVFGREPKMTERHIIAQMLAEDCGNERLTMVLKRCIDLKIVPSSLNYIVTGFNNEKGKVIRIESVQPKDNWWADLIES